MTLTLTSPAFTHQGAIPSHYTCEGKDVSPPLSWSGVPPATKSLAFILDDPDAPDPAAPKRTWVHWVLYNIPPTATRLEEAVKPSALPAGTPYAADGPRAGRTSPDCGYDRGYARAGTYQVSATTFWTVEWSGGGESGEIAQSRVSGTVPVQINELQVVTR